MNYCPLCGETMKRYFITESATGPHHFDVCENMNCLWLQTIWDEE